MSSHHKDLVGSTLFQDLCSSNKAFHIINDIILRRHRNTIKPKADCACGPGVDLQGTAALAMCKTETLAISAAVGCEDSHL